MVDINFYGRRSGATTKIADWTIQRLFEGKEVMLYDHYRESDLGDRRLLKIIQRRLGYEHRREILQRRYDDIIYLKLKDVS